MSSGKSGRPPANRIVVADSAFVAPSAQLFGDVTIGEHGSVWFGCVLRADLEPIRIGDRSNVQDLSVIHVDPGYPTTIENDVTVGHRAVIHGAILEEGCLVGIGAVVLSGARVGRGALVAAGAVVREGFHVPPHSLAAGVPARVLRELSPEERSRVADNSKTYVESARLFRDGAYGENADV